MAVLKPFRAIRPRTDLAEAVAALPYDVMSSEEARGMVEGKPYSFLHIDRGEIDLDPSVDPYDPAVYKRAASNLKEMSKEGIMVQEQKPCLYLYRQIMNGRSQTGVVGCVSVDDYLENRIKKHELTRADKEQDRIRHVDACNANTGPIFLTYGAKKEIHELMEKWMETAPLYDFVAEDQVQHTVWIIADQADVQKLETLFEQVPALYIADGHHRAASAVQVAKMRRKEHSDYDGSEEFNYFLAVLFPDEELKIMDYNRVLKQWNGWTPETLLEQLEKEFVVTKLEQGMYKPEKIHTFGMYMDGQWYGLEAKEGTFPEGDPVESLDVSILQKNVLTPLFDIQDPRVDDRISFIGGIRGLEELERLVDGGCTVAFAMYPTSIKELMEIADTGNLMPPKSTWFEPKLRSGLFIHDLG